MSSDTEAQERAAFEKAMAAEGYELNPQQYRDGTYRESYYAAGWAMWQARAALAQQAATPEVGISGVVLRELVRWAYGKLHYREFVNPGDALMLDAMKLELEHGQ